MAKKDLEIRDKVSGMDFQVIVASPDRLKINEIYSRISMAIRDVLLGDWPEQESVVFRSRQCTASGVADKDMMRKLNKTPLMYGGNNFLICLKK